MSSFCKGARARGHKFVGKESQRARVGVVFHQPVFADETLEATRAVNDLLTVTQTVKSSDKFLARWSFCDALLLT